MQNSYEINLLLTVSAMICCTTGRCLQVTKSEHSNSFLTQSLSCTQEAYQFDTLHKDAEIDSG